MSLAIEHQIRASRKMLIGTALLGLGAVSVDFALVRFEQALLFPRFLLGTITLLVYVHLVSGLQTGSVPGFTLLTWQEWRRWLLLLVGGTAIISIVSVMREAWIPPPPSQAPIDLPLNAVYSFVVSPIYEEVIYRLALCPPSSALLGRCLSIILNGIIFAVLHCAYGTLSLYNAVGGFVLAWIFMRSRSIVVAIVAHSMGNIAIIMTPLAYEHFART
jgi:membrane protease YdiL (CAAX protease family)